MVYVIIVIGCRAPAVWRVPPALMVYVIIVIGVVTVRPRDCSRQRNSTKFSQPDLWLSGANGGNRYFSTVCNAGMGYMGVDTTALTGF